MRQLPAKQTPCDVHGMPFVVFTEQAKFVQTGGGGGDVGGGVLLPRLRR
jgi:hypothetical protein